MKKQIGNIVIENAKEVAKEFGFNTFIGGSFVCSGDAYNRGGAEYVGDKSHEAFSAEYDYSTVGNRPEPMYIVKSVCGKFARVYKRESYNNGASQVSSCYFEV